jgi:hypothetical protein
MKNKLSNFFGTLLVVSILIISNSRLALAAKVSDACWFNTTNGPVQGVGTCTVQGNTEYGDYGKNDVLPGRLPGPNGPIGQAIPNSINTKSEFVNFITNKFTNGNAHEKVGAAFIVQTMRPGQPHSWPSNADFNNWVYLMNQPSVSVFRANITVGRTSYFDFNKKNAFFARHTNANRDVIAITQGGRAGYVEMGCGNMVAGVQPLQDTTPQWNISATSSVAPSAVVGTQVTFTHRLYNNGPNAVNGSVTGNIDTDYGVQVPHALDLWNGYGISYREVTHNYTFNTAGRYCESVGFSPVAWNNGSWGHSANACITVVAPDVSVDLADYEKGGASPNIIHTVSVPGCSSSFLINWHIFGTEANGLGYDNDVSSVISPTTCLAQVEKTVDKDFLDKKNPGHTIYYESRVGSKIAPKTLTVYEVPYARFYGQDIYATADAAAASNIYFNTNTKVGAGSAGSTSQYAAITQKLIGTIKINTAAFRGSSPSPNDGLKAQWTSAPNASDIYTKVKNNLKINSTPGSQTNVITSIPVGGVTIAKDDNIYIDKNITEGTQDKIALFVAGRDIYIAPDVTRIDAVLIARGTVYTCATNSASTPTRQNWQNNAPDGCRNTLTINGAVSAKNIKFQRSIGTRLMASASEDNGPTGQAGKGNIDSRGGGNTSTAAEVINYPAYLNFSSLNLKDTSTNSVNAIFNAPPLL